MAPKTRQPRERAGFASLGKLLTARNAAAMVGGVALAWYALAATATTVLPDRLPDAATSLGLTGADALASQSLNILEAQPTPAKVKRAQALARASLAREPINTSALRALGLSATVQGDDVKAQQLFEASERLSRRDLAAQLWLIENAVKRGDIAGTLVHYDRALRTSDRSAGLLIPVLADATAEPLVAAELTKLLAKRPPWWPAYFEQLISATKSPASLALVTNTLNLKSSDEGERQLLVGAMVKLTQMGAYNPAYDLYRRNADAKNWTQLVRNGGFEQNDLLPPFDWSYAGEADLAGSIEPRTDESADMALHLLVDEGRSGEIARQLLMLRPGSYRFSAIAGNVKGSVTSRPAIEVICASSPPRANEAVLVTLTLPEATSTGRRFTGMFTVPQSCPAQLLMVRVNGGSAQEGDPAWVDSIQVQPA